MLIPPDDDALWRAAGVEVVARGGSACASLADVCGKNRTSFYADPVSWLVAEAVERAVGRSPQDLRAIADDVATITISDFCTTATMRQIAAGVRSGRLSPLRFSAATPGAVGSLPAMSFGFKGPSVTLSMRPEKGLPVAVTVAGSWLATGLAAFAVLASHDVVATGGHAVTSVIITGPTER